MKNNFKFLFLLLITGLTIASCKKDVVVDEPTAFKQVDDYSNEAVYEWNETFLQVERYAAGYRPGPAPKIGRAHV